MTSVPKTIPGFLISGPDSHKYKERIQFLLGRKTDSKFNNKTHIDSRFPGAQPVSFDNSHLQQLLTQDFCVSEKADGIRCLLYTTISLAKDGKIHPTTFLIDRKNEYYGLFFGLPAPPGSPHKFLTDTLLDGELIFDVEPDGRTKLYFLLFDCLVYSGEPVFMRSYEKRLGYLRQNVLDPYFNLIRAEERNRDVQNKYKDSHPFEIRLKKLERSYGMENVFKQIKMNKHASDGIIFTASEAPYTFGTCETMIKWKPSEENTVDFLVRKTVKGQGRDEYDLYLNYGKEGYKIECPFYLGEDAKKLQGQNLDNRYIECKYDRNWPHNWRFSRFRDDKESANHISTFVKVMESIKDDISKEKLLAMTEEIRRNWKARQEVEKSRSAKKRAGEDQAHNKKRLAPGKQYSGSEKTKETETLLSTDFDDVADETPSNQTESVTEVVNSKSEQKAESLEENIEESSSKLEKKQENNVENNVGETPEEAALLSTDL